MSKKNLLISAALATFVLVVLANVSAVYARIRDAVTVRPTAVAAEALPVQNQLAQVTHEEAASLAANFLGQNDLYSVENTVWNGIDAYKVVFSSGTIVYVGMERQILGTEAPQPLVISAPAQNNTSASAASYNENQDDHEERGEHEEHEGHDD